MWAEEEGFTIKKAEKEEEEGGGGGGGGGEKNVMPDLDLSRYVQPPTSLDLRRRRGGGGGKGTSSSIHPPTHPPTPTKQNRYTKKEEEKKEVEEEEEEEEEQVPVPSDAVGLIVVRPTHPTTQPIQTHVSSSSYPTHPSSPVPHSNRLALLYRSS